MIFRKPRVYVIYKSYVFRHFPHSVEIGKVARSIFRAENHKKQVEFLGSEFVHILVQI